MSNIPFNLVTVDWMPKGIIWLVPTPSDEIRRHGTDSIEEWLKENSGLIINIKSVRLDKDEAKGAKMSSMSIPFRLFDTTNEAIYLPNVKLEKITFRMREEDDTKSIIFHLRERIIATTTSYLLNLSKDTEISVIHRICEDPRVYDKSQRIASFAVDRIHQIDVSNIGAMGSSDTNVVEVLAQIEVLITEQDIDNILESMNEEEN